MKLIRHTLILVLLNFSITSFAQEIRGLNFNPAITRAAKEVKLKSAGDPIVPLPKGKIFFDDFSVFHIYGNTIYPESDNWLDKYATVTQTFADSAISIGTVTLDCFNSKGQVYGSGSNIPSDTLTSKLISIKGDSSLYISFFIQGGGKVDAPEPQDSLVLEFHDTKNEIWFSAWSIPGYDSTRFTQITLAINDSLISDSSFQFRFRNFTSLSVNEAQGKEGALSNADNWHIDYIQIVSTSNPDELELLNDITIYAPQLPIFRDYSSIPYSHIQYASSDLRAESTIHYRTLYSPLDTGVININRWQLYLDKTNNEIIERTDKDGIQTNSSSFAFIEKTDDFRPQFKTQNYPNQTWGEFHLKSYIQNLKDDSQYPWNDTVTKVDIYRNYYAYDDGSAEFGFGISGADAYESAFATEFETYHKGGLEATLTGVYIYFNQAAEDYTANMEFQVGVWAESGHKPADTLYLPDETNLHTPEFEQGINGPTHDTVGFMRINFERDVLVPRFFFIGIQQYTNEFLNVGYDVSFNSKSKTWYYADNTWNKLSSIKDGSLMIRPIFDNNEDLTSINKTSITEKIDISVYPNPFSDYLNVDISGNNIEDYQFTISDLLGRQITSGPLKSSTLNVDYLSSGIYILTLRHIASNKTYTHKILKRN